MPTRFLFNKLFKFSFRSLLFLILFLSTFIACIAWVILHPAREGMPEHPKDYELHYEDISFDSIIDKTTLEGWWIPAQGEFVYREQSTETIIFAHGFGDSRTGMPIKSLKLAKFLANEGYNVLMFDFRNSGTSEGSMTTIGYYEKYDILSAVNIAKERGSKHIGVIGWSMGASSAIMATSVSDDITAVVADSPFSDFNNYIEEKFTYWTNLPEKLSPLFVSTTETFIGLDYTKVSPTNAARIFKNSDKSMFLIHGKKDRAIPYHNSVEIKKSNPNAELWLIEETGHIRGYKNAGDAYEKRILEFFDKNLRRKSVEQLYAFLF